MNQYDSSAIEQLLPDDATALPWLALTCIDVVQRVGHAVQALEELVVVESLRVLADPVLVARDLEGGVHLLHRRGCSIALHFLLTHPHTPARTITHRYQPTLPKPPPTPSRVAVTVFCGNPFGLSNSSHLTKD